MVRITMPDVNAGFLVNIQPWEGRDFYVYSHSSKHMLLTEGMFKIPSCYVLIPMHSHCQAEV
jgi:hypothetical protein